MEMNHTNPTDVRVQQQEKECRTCFVEVKGIVSSKQQTCERHVSNRQHNQCINHTDRRGCNGQTVVDCFCGLFTHLTGVMVVTSDRNRRATS